jgi:hypothetical protein
MKHKEVSFPTIIGIFVALGGLLSGLWLVRQQTNKVATALEEDSPREVRVTNVTDLGFSASWTTNKAVPGYVYYGEGQEEINVVALDERDVLSGDRGSYFTHWVMVKGLKPQSEYKFSIISGKNSYGEEGGEKAYVIKTAPTLSTFPTADVAYGQVLNGSGEVVGGALIYVKIPGAVMQSTLSKSNGSWVIPLSTARDDSLAQYVKYDPGAGIIEISVDAGPAGTTNAVTNTDNDSPVPNMILGKTYDFVMAGTEGASKFSSQPVVMMTGTAKIEIVAPKAEEKVNTTRPEIVGKAPAGTVVTVEIHSETNIVGKTTADSLGNFSFSIAEDLSPGEHVVTVSTLIDGVIQKVSKTFVVYAVGESSVPSYSATPSATLIPTRAPTATPRPTVTPTATPKPTATATPTPKPTITPTVIPSTATTSATPKPTATATPTKSPTSTPLPTRITPPVSTESAIPVAGNTDWTWTLLVIGFAMIGSGWWWYRKSA